MLKEAIKTIEELKKYVYVIDRGEKENIVIKFENSNFYHLLGLHKTKINNFFPNKMMSKDKIYKYIKRNVDKFENILNNLLNEENRIKLRILSFPYILNLLNDTNSMLYDLSKNRPVGSLYNGDYGLFKILKNIYCLFGLKIDSIDNKFINCAPQSWMPSDRKNSMIEFKRPIYMKEILKIPLNLFKDELVEV